MRISPTRPYLIYLAKFGGFFCLFYFGTLLIIGLSSPVNRFSPFVADYFDYVSPLRFSLLWCTDQLLRLFGYSTQWSDQYTLGFAGGHAVRMVYSCVGYGVMSFWAAFVLANQGSSQKRALWLVGGLLLLYCLNILRLFFLILAINRDHHPSFSVDHHSVFNAVAYALIFLLIYLYDRQYKRVAATLTTQ